MLDLRYSLVIEATRSVFSLLLAGLPGFSVLVTPWKMPLSS